MLQRAERAHYRLQAALYLRRRRDLPGMSLFSAGEIPEPEWNHAALLDMDDSDLGRGLDEARSFYRDRPPTIAVSPFSRPADLPMRLRDEGFEPSFRHFWLVYAGSAKPPVEAPAGIEIAVVDRPARMRAFVEVFETVYADDPEDDVSELSPGYARALWASYRDGGRGVVHYLATVGGRPAAVGTLLHGRGFGGLYNAAVLPAHRRRGLAAALTARRVAAALDRGARVVFLQTEATEAWQCRHGFEPAFETVGFTAP